MASGDTKTQQYLDVAANGTRADLPSDTCCETRTQTLIRGVAERIMDVEDEVERLENNPDVADIVATYADLQAYPTSQLTDKDVIRVLQDETHDGNSTYYRWSTTTQIWTYIGESKQYTDFVGTDGTAGGQNGLVPAPVATDAGKFLNANGSWEEVDTGGVTELTTTDYNYPTANPTGIAWWLLDEGNYKFENLAFYSASASGAAAASGALSVTKTSSYVEALFVEANQNRGRMFFYDINNSTLFSREILTTSNTVDNLTSIFTGWPLSANQGRVLKNLIDSIAIRGAGAPTTSTVGEVGQLYEDGTNGALYQLKSIDITTTPNTYNWEQVGGSSVNVVQTTGTSTTDVMSQNAVTIALATKQDTATISNNTLYL